MNPENDENAEGEGPSPTNAELFGILENLAHAVHAQGSQAIYQQARLDALESVVLALGSKAGIAAPALSSLLGQWREAFYQRRLDALEDQHPAAAASADIRPGIPDLDPQILDQIRRAFEDLEDHS